MQRQEMRREIDQRFQMMRSLRSPFEARWRDIQSYIYPRRGRFFEGANSRPEQSRHNKIVDSTATRASRHLAAGLAAGITSPARKWFKLTTQDPSLREYQPVREWLDMVERIMFEVFASSNFYQAAHTLYSEIGDFGTGVMLIEEDFRDVVRCYPWTVGAYWLDTGFRGDVDVAYHKVPMSVRQVVDKFGLDAVSTSVRSAWDQGNYSEYLEVLHAIEPADMHDDEALDMSGHKWASIWCEVAANGVLGVRGYGEFPVIAPRWDVRYGDIYGEGPGSVVLGDVKQLQVQQRSKGVAIEKMVNPPLQAPTNMARSAVYATPGGMNFTDQVGPQGGIRPIYEVNPRIGELMADIQSVQQRISDGYFENLFLMLANSDRRQITAREIEERHEEKLLMLGPVLERLHSEALDPIIDRVFTIASNAQILPPAPQEIQGSELKIEFISILAQAQKAIGTASIERVFQFVGAGAQMSPDLIDKVDFDQALDEYSDMLPLPSSVIRSDEDVAAIRAERMKAQQAAQAMEMAQQASQTANNLGNIPTQEGGSNAAADILRQVTGG